MGQKMSEEQYHVKDSDIKGFFVFLSVTLTDFQRHTVCLRTVSFEGGQSSWDHDDILFLESKPATIPLTKFILLGPAVKSLP